MFCWLQVDISSIISIETDVGFGFMLGFALDIRLAVVSTKLLNRHLMLSKTSNITSSLRNETFCKYYGIFLIENVPVRVRHCEVGVTIQKDRLGEELADKR